jgi:hypothetical protein
VENFITSKKTERDIKGLQLYCDHHQDGCSWKGSWSDLNEHLEKCSYVPIQCKWKNCKIIQPRSTIKKHQEQCKWRIIKCEYCNNEMPFKSISVSNNNN